MRVAISGASGLIGTALGASLNSDGHDVLRLVRGRPATSADQVAWDPAAGWLDVPRLEGVEAVVNLAGASVLDRRWSDTYKRVLRFSRVGATQTLASALARLDKPPRVLVSASATAYYGPDRGADILDEDEPAGNGFLAGLCAAWEAAAASAQQADVAVCHARLGIVMSSKGGALERMLPWFRKGLGGPLGGGRQYWSYVSLGDAVRALRFLIETHGCSGPYDITVPEPVTNAEFSRVLARALNRPTLLPVPASVLRIRFGDLAEDLMGSLRVVPGRLLDAEFDFDHPDARSVVAAALR